MKKIKVAPGAMFTVGQGSLVELSPQQAAARQHRLEAVDQAARYDGLAVYRVKDTIQLKGGEVLAVPGVDKGQAHLVEIEGGDTLAQAGKDDEGGFNPSARPHGRRNR